MYFFGYAMFRWENMYINIIRWAKRLSVKDLRDQCFKGVKFNCNNKF